MKTRACVELTSQRSTVPLVDEKEKRENNVLVEQRPTFSPFPFPPVPWARTAHGEEEERIAKEKQKYRVCGDIFFPWAISSSSSGSRVLLPLARRFRTLFGN